MNRGIWITDDKGNRRPARALIDPKTGRRCWWEYTDEKGGKFEGFKKPAPPKITKPATDK